MDWLKLDLLNVFYFLPASIFFFKVILPLGNEILMVVYAIALIAIYALIYFRIIIFQNDRKPLKRQSE